VIATAEPMLQTELWVSFVSMLRSYAAAASLHAGEVGVRLDGNDVAIAAGDVQLAMHFDAESGVVSWTKRTACGEPIAGEFEILADGVLAIHGVARELDHAAIDFIASVTDGAKGGRP
jgi:hypothetical protein